MTLKIMVMVTIMIHNTDEMPSDEDLEVHGPGDGVDDGQETETLDGRQTAEEEAPGGRGQIQGGFHFQSGAHGSQSLPDHKMWRRA